MPEKTYTYYGPMSGVTLAADADYPNGRQVQFIRGGKVTLPDDNDYVKSLVAQGYLKPTPEPVTATDPAASESSVKTSSTSAVGSSTSSVTTSTVKSADETSTGSEA